MNDISTTLKDELREVLEILGKPYVTAVSAPVATTLTSALTNFMRNGPKRKVFVLRLWEGDYDYDEEMSLEKEIDFQIKNGQLYDATLKLLEEQYVDHVDCRVHDLYRGLHAEGWPDDLAMTDYQDESKDGLEYDDVEWTPEYEGGALCLATDSGRVAVWSIEDEHLVLQEVEWHGDGNFVFGVLITISPNSPSN